MRFVFFDIGEQVPGVPAVRRTLSARRQGFLRLISLGKTKKMDLNVKEGKLFIQHHKFGKKLKWRKVWLVLYGASQHGVARLELLRCAGTEDGPVSRRPGKKVLRLSDCVSVREAPGEPCPGDGMAAFVVETTEKSYIFASEQQTTTDWVEKLRLIAFQADSRRDFSIQQSIQMAENTIYDSLEEVHEFCVSVRASEAADRCGLRGAYWLRVTRDGLVLLEPETKEMLLCWPYRLLRRYGNDKETFTIEAGRRCASGPGGFSFETRQSLAIFALMEERIRQEVRSSGCHGDELLEGQCEGEGGVPRHPRAHSPLPPTPRSSALMELTSPYANPADLLRPTAVSCCHSNQPEPVYSDVDRDLAQQTGALVLEGCAVARECRGAEEDSPTHLYSHVMKRAAPSSLALVAPDVIYDSLGQI
ncbi:docking protein 1-like isoform X1 [Paramormyrops kingsleyae]|uniref:docking protein 1-like isoform X1 n=2 Tax=Paramormyrops kingsleyae TaxID=1676925 RepID=UPI003B96AAD9